MLKNKKQKTNKQTKLKEIYLMVIDHKATAI